MSPGATLTIERSGERDVVIRRTFAAPRAVVFDAWTKPELLRRWYGPMRWRLTTCEIDLRVDGRFRFVMTSGDDTMSWVGVYRVVSPPERLVSVERYDNEWAGGETTTTVTFDEVDGSTAVTSTIEYCTPEARDAAHRSVGADGLEEAFAGLDELLGESQRTDAALRYARRAARFGQLIRSIEAPMWSAPSPCADWTALQVVGHVIDMHAAMLAPLDRRLDPGPPLDDDPAGAFASALASVQRVFDETIVADSMIPTPMGPMTAAGHIDTALSVDLVLHAWDLARATGQDDTINDEDLQLILPIAQAMPPVLRVPGAFRPGLVVFGPEVAVAGDAPIQHRVLGLYGRDPHWAA